MKRIGHTAVWRGKRVRCFMRDGSSFIAKFKDKNKTDIMFIDHGTVKKNEMRTLTIYKGEQF